MKLIAYSHIIQITQGTNTNYREVFEIENIVWLRADINYPSEFLESISEDLASVNQIFGEDAEHTAVSFNPKLDDKSKRIIKERFDVYGNNLKSGVAIQKYDKNGNKIINVFVIKDYNSKIRVPDKNTKLTETLTDEIHLKYLDFVEQNLNTLTVKEYRVEIKKVNKSLDKKIDKLDEKLKIPSSRIISNLEHSISKKQVELAITAFDAKTRLKKESEVKALIARKIFIENISNLDKKEIEKRISSRSKTLLTSKISTPLKERKEKELKELQSRLNLIQKKIDDIESKKLNIIQLKAAANIRRLKLEHYEKARIETVKKYSSISEKSKSTKMFFELAKSEIKDKTFDDSKIIKTMLAKKFEYKEIEKLVKGYSPNFAGLSEAEIKLQLDALISKNKIDVDMNRPKPLTSDEQLQQQLRNKLSEAGKTYERPKG